MLKKRIPYFVSIIALSMFFLLSIKSEAASYQLERTDTTMRCKDQDTGNYVTSRFITLQGYTYYFDADGTAHTGWLNIGHNYYFFNSNGAMMKQRWVGEYYFLKSGKMATSRWIKKVYVGADGRRIQGYRQKVKPKFVKTSGGTKYRTADGTYAQKTWLCIKGKWYYFYSNGIMATKRRIGRYYVDKHGRMLINKSVKIGKYRYSYGADGQQVRKQKL